MSAIFGAFHFDSAPAVLEELQRMNSALISLGPDDGDVWCKGHVGLGHRLLRLTPEDKFEIQPVLDAPSGCVLVSDARIDNRAELSEELGFAPAATRLMPNSQFILQAYLKWGTDAVGHLLGSFAFALYDQQRNHVVLARSSRGERTLFFHETQNSLTFATAPKGLFALPSIPRSINPERVADFLVCMPAEAGSTFYREVRTISPGQLLVVEPNRRRTKQFWSLASIRRIRYSKDSDYVEAFNALFDRVIADHLRSLTPVGILVSGGLDSSSVAAVAAPKLMETGAKLSAFTEVPSAGFSGAAERGRYSDETPYVSALAKMYPNIDLQLVRTDGAFFLDDLQQFFNAAETPLRNGSNRVWWEAILKLAGDRGIRVLLTGIPGNLTISWNGHHVLPHLLRCGRLVRAVVEARAMAHHGTSGSTLRALAGGALPLLPRRAAVAVQCFRQARLPAKPWSRYSLIRPSFAKEQSIEERAIASGHDLHFLGANSARAKTLLRKDMAADIGRGHLATLRVETRHPPDDQRVLEFCLGLPEDQFHREGVSRSLIRRAMDGRLPAEILDNRRRGLQAADWAERYRVRQGELLNEVDAIGKSPLANHAVDVERLRHLVQKFKSGGANGGRTDLTDRTLLEVGMLTGAFLKWVESGVLTP